jgi:hypothetical protein
MEEQPFPLITKYRIVLYDDGTFGVEITKPGAPPYCVCTFQTEGEANNWIAEHKAAARTAAVMRRRQRDDG